jgi:thiol-disulfide isomerase/thioredoxin
VINYWSPSYVPCQDEAPILVQVAREYDHGGMVFLGVTFGGSRDEISNFVRRYGIPCACGQAAINTVAPAYGLVAIPVTVVVDRYGTVARTIQMASREQAWNRPSNKQLATEYKRTMRALH